MRQFFREKTLNSPFHNDRITKNLGYAPINKNLGYETINYGNNPLRWPMLCGNGNEMGPAREPLNLALKKPSQDLAPSKFK